MKDGAKIYLCKVKFVLNWLGIMILCGENQLKYYGNLLLFKINI